MSEIRGTVPGIVPLKGKPVAITTIHTDAYMIACRNGFEGTEEEWLAALNGKSAYDSAKEGGYAGTEAEFYADLALFDERAQTAREAEVSAAASASGASQSAGAAAGSANAASGHANAANNSATAAASSESSAKASKESAAASEQNAKKSETAAGTSERNAKASENAAATSAQNAANAAQSVAGQATAAGRSAEAAAASANQAAQSATNAAGSEQSVANNAAAAKRSAEQASASEIAARAAQAAAEQARDEAQGIAGGDFASTSYVDGKAATAEQNANSYTNDQISAHNESSGAHADIRQAASAAQTTANEAKAAAANAQSTANSKANASHGNHVPATETANNARFLRNDNTWQDVTPDNIGASAAGHNHDDRYYTEGEIDAKLQNLPVVGHTHTKSEITDFPSTMAPTAHTHSKSEITDFPSTMPPSAHSHTKSEITDFPTSMPASDVPSWAKEASKPSYTPAELGLTTELWTFTLEDGSVVPKAVYVGEVPPITFTIDGTSYTANGGSTWGEWVNSAYNTDGYNVGNYNFIFNSAGTRYVEGSNPTYPTPDTVIQANYAYTTVKD